jgi:hypothetical protein
MAIKDIDTGANIKINVVMKNGLEYLGCDIPSRPLSESERAFAFWYENAVRMVPLQDVLWVEYHEDKSA